MIIITYISKKLPVILYNCDNNVYKKKYQQGKEFMRSILLVMSVPKYYLLSIK